MTTRKMSINSLFVNLTLLTVSITIQSTTLSDLIGTSVDTKVLFANQTHKQIRLTLSDTKFVDISVDNRRKHLKFSQNIDILDNRCLFSGTIVDKQSVIGTALINICPNSSQMIGILESVDHQIYTFTVIDRNDNSNEKDRSKRSVSSETIVTKQSNDEGICGNFYFEPNMELPVRLRSEPNITDDNKKFSPGTVNLAFYVDQHLFFNRFQSDETIAKEFVAIHIAYLQKQLQQKSLFVNIQLKLSVIHFGVVPFVVSHQWSTKKLLKDFCKWSGRQDIDNITDINILFTGTNLWYYLDEKSSTISQEILGMSYTHHLCRQYKCIVVESVSGFLSLHTLVHEMGHSLGAHHDGDDKWGNAHCADSRFIMSPTISAGKTQWSNCSIRQMRQQFLSLRREPDHTIVCLKDKLDLGVEVGVDINTDKALMPGRYYSADEQCKLSYGQTYSYRGDYFNRMCTKLRCRNPFFMIATSGALEGTPCGDNRVCDRDLCKKP